MNTLQNLFEQAQLAEAAYANFIDPLTAKQGAPCAPKIASHIEI